MKPDQMNRSIKPAKKLTKWSNEPTVMDLKGDLQVAQPSHDATVNQIQEWVNLRNVEGAAKPKSYPMRSAVQPKMIRRNNEWRYSALSEPFLSAETLFKISPNSWEDEQAAEQNGQILEYQFRTKIDRVRFIDDYVRATTDEGTSYVKPGWCRETKMEMVDVPVYEYTAIQDEQEIQVLQMALELYQANPQGFEELPDELKASVEYWMETQIPVIATQIDMIQEEQEKMVKNHPILELLPFQNVYIDPACEGDLDKANFVIISFETSKARLLKDKRYKNLNLVNWSSNTPLTEPNHSTVSDPATTYKDDLRRPVVAFEYWGFYDVNGDETLVPIVATWIGDVMIRMEENPYPDEKIPLVVVPYMPLSRSVHGEPDAALLGDNQSIMGAVTRGMIDLLGRSANGQMGRAKGMLDAVNTRRFERGEDYEFNMQVTPDSGFYQHKYPEIPASALNMLSLQNQEAEAISGVKSFSGGLSGQAYGDVAAGIRGMLDAASKREMSILRRLASGMEKIGRKLISMNQAFLSEEEVVQITNDKFIRVLRSDIQGEFNVVVDINTAEVEEAKAQDLGFMLQTMGNTLPFEMTQKILVEIARLKRMPKLSRMLAEYKPQPDPLQEKLKELEIAKLEAEIAELQAKAMRLQAEARAKASEADLKDLNFLEQETGTKHARDMQKVQTQAESNQMLEITKGVLKEPQKRPSDGNLMTAMAMHEAATSRT